MDSDFGAELYRHGISITAFAKRAQRSRRYIRMVANGYLEPSGYLVDILKQMRRENTPEQTIMMKIEQGIKSNASVCFPPDELSLLGDSFVSSLKK